MWAWRIGSVQGIDLKIHLTFPLVLVWAAVEFGGGRTDGTLFALYGAILVLLLFGCVLLHELGHALVALRCGVPVAEIILLPIGGLAKLRAMKDDPLEEFLITAAGPLVNALIALFLLPILLWLLGFLDPMVWELAPGRGLRLFLGQMLRAMQRISVEGAVAYLFFANVTLCLFNLIPAFPLDGGRLVRAILAVLLPYRIATLIAVRLGQLLALLMALWGFREGGGMILVALFVLFGGRAELQRVAQREVLTRGNVSTYMMRGLHPLFPQWSLHSARLVAQQTGQRAFPVIEEGRLLGLLTVREIHQHSPASTVGEAMVADYSVLAPARTLYDAQVTLQGQDHFAAAIMEGGVLLGLLSVEDIERAYQALRHPQALHMA